MIIILFTMVKNYTNIKNSVFNFWTIKNFTIIIWKRNSFTDFDNFWTIFSYAYNRCSIDLIFEIYILFLHFLDLEYSNYFAELFLFRAKKNMLCLYGIVVYIQYNFRLNFLFTFVIRLNCLSLYVYI